MSVLVKCILLFYICIRTGFHFLVLVWVKLRGPDKFWHQFWYYLLANHYFGKMYGISSQNSVFVILRIVPENYILSCIHIICTFSSFSTIFAEDSWFPILRSNLDFNFGKKFTNCSYRFPVWLYASDTNMLCLLL